MTTSVCKFCGREKPPLDKHPSKQNRLDSTSLCAEPVCEKELGQEMPIENVESWVTELCTRYHDDSHWYRFFSEKRGLAKYIQDELMPLRQFCKNVTDQYRGFSLQYYLGSRQSFDARILTPNGEVAETIEVTLACNGYQDSLVSELVASYGQAPLYSNIQPSGSRSNRILSEAELVSLDANETVDGGLNQISIAVARKDNPEKYTGMNLLVGFDAFRYLSVQHFERLRDHVGAIESCFSTIYYVGLTGNTFIQVSNGHVLQMIPVLMPSP